MEDISKEKVERFSAVSVATPRGRRGDDGTSSGATEDHEVLKRRISSHPLYDLLVKNHLDCLKASMGNTEGLQRSSVNQSSNEINSRMPASSELDHFMEMYCLALRELKVAIEEPLQESKGFIDSMYLQLTELLSTGTSIHSKPEQISPPASPSEQREE